MRVLLLTLAACGSSTSPRAPVRAGTPPPSDEAGFRKLLVGEVRTGGLWFPDTDCQTRFGRPGAIKPDAFDAFARCVASLHLLPTGRTHWLDDSTVLTDDVGFEIEAHVANARLDYIGFSGRAPGMPDLPTITPETLEKLRTSGDSRATISAEDAKRVVLPKSPKPTHDEHLRICLNESGQVITVMPATTTSPASAAAFSAIARTWTFKPFVVAGNPIAVCASVAFQYPMTPTGPERRLPRPPKLSKRGNIIYNVSPLDLPPRIAGDRNVVPDDEDKIRLNGKRISGSFKLCLDETGHYEEGTLLQSTGVPRYDAKIVRELMRWVYSPFLIDGVATPVCTAVTFIYSQS